MFGGNGTLKLMIVCTRETEKYGKYLMQLISLKDDEGENQVGLKDDSVEAVLWSEKDYEANRAQLPASARILFIGDSRQMQEESANMNDQLDMYGMHFFHLGSRAVIRVDKKILKKEEYENFLSFCSDCGKNFEEKAKLNFLNTMNTKVKWAGVFAPMVYPAFIYGLISGRGAREKINDQQYKFLIFYSYMEILPQFLKG